MDRERSLALLAALSTPPPDDEPVLHLLYIITSIVMQQPPRPLLNIRNRLFGSLENYWIGRDVFELFSQHPYEFFEITGETPESLLAIVNDVHVNLHNYTGHPFALSPRNRVMLFLIWCRSYPCLSLLSLLFDVASSTIGVELNKMRVIMWNTYAASVTWPASHEWQRMRGVWSDLPDAVAAIDGTSHAIYRPGVEPQEQYYSGHRHTHCIHTIVIVDNQGMLRHVSSGFLGHQNDAQSFNYLPNIGPGMELDFPGNCLILGDKIFSNRYPVMTPYTRQQLHAKPLRLRRKCERLNNTISRYRITVEHAIREIKIYRVISTLWRHPRCHISSIVDICAALAVRRRRLFNQ